MLVGQRRGQLFAIVASRLGIWTWPSCTRSWPRAASSPRGIQQNQGRGGRFTSLHPVSPPEGWPRLNEASEGEIERPVVDRGSSCGEPTWLLEGVGDADDRPMTRSAQGAQASWMAALIVAGRGRDWHP
jgi:hypothetical protein